MQITLKTLGLYKATLRRKYYSTGRKDIQMEELLARRTTTYTLEEIEYLAGYLMTGTDVCVLANPDAYSPVEVWTAQRNEATLDRIMAFLGRWKRWELTKENHMEDRSGLDTH